MGLRPTKCDEDAVWRAHFCVPRSHSCERQGFGREGCSQECEHGTQECVRHGRSVGSISWAGVFNGAGA